MIFISIYKEKYFKLMGTIKISEHRIIIKKNNQTETYIKTFNPTSNSWIVYNNNTYHLINIEEDDEI